MSARKDTTSRAAAGVAFVGLVPSKTTLDSTIEISFAPSVVAERRVKRLKKSVWASGHLHGLAENGFRPSVPWFVTLTYSNPNGWMAEHVAKAIQGFRNWCVSKGVPCRYTWVAEIQPKRLETTGDAVVHYHLLAWLPVGLSMPHWDRPTRKQGGERAAFWGHGMSNTEIAKSGVGYLMKYLSKLGELTRFPKGLRLYGIGGLNDTGRKVRQWFNLPEWCKNGFGVGEVLRKSGRLVVRDTGELLQSPYEVFKVFGGLVVRAVRPVAERFHDGVYSSYSWA